MVKIVQSSELLMMSGVPLEKCWAFNKLWNNKFYYKAASCWYFYPVILRCTDPWVSNVIIAWNILWWRFCICPKFIIHGHHRTVCVTCAFEKSVVNLLKTKMNLNFM